jgi:phosphoglycerate dehydrogenase-like enzyme
MIVRVLGDLDQRRREMLEADANGVTIVYAGDDAAPEALFVWAQERSSLTHIAELYGPTLRWVHFRRVGVPDATLNVFRQFPQVQLTTGSGASGIAVAEHALALLLALLKRLPELGKHQAERSWRHEFTAAELHGQTVCIVGLGDVGRSTARLLRAFGVRILGVRRGGEPLPEVDEMHTPAALASVLRRSTVLILAATLTPETRHMIGAQQLAQLPPGALVINVARGAVMDEMALIESLRTGHIGGAGLDVLVNEPPAPDSPLWDLPNVILTPHSAAHTTGTDDRAVALFLDNLERFRRGDPLANCVSR